LAFDLCTASSVVVHDKPGSTASTILQVSYATVGFAVLCWRGRWPTWVFAAQCAHTILAWLLLHEYRPVAGLIVAVYTIASLRCARTSGTALACAAGCGLLYGFDSWRVQPNPSAKAGEFAVTVLMFAAIYAAAFGIGTAVRVHRADTARHERDQALARAEAVTMERERLGASLHDTLSPPMTIMVLHAAGAQRLTNTAPERVRESLEHIQHSGQRAMAELRRLLDDLHIPKSHTDTGPQSAPRQGIADLPKLVSCACREGLAATVQTTGVAAGLSPAVETVAYQTVREGLANTLKHAGPGTNVQVRLDWEAEALVLQVTDDGCGQHPLGQPALEPGHGLSILRSRLRGVGGTLATYHLGGEGFAVVARLPTVAAAPASSTVGPVPSS
jgi:signal transduction histidine kinase